MCRPAPGQAPVLLLMGVWALTVILFFSMPRSKLVGYILPALAPLVFFVAQGFVHAPSSASWGKRVWAVLAALSVLLSLSAVVYLSGHPEKSTWELSGTLRAQRQAGEPVVMFNNPIFLSYPLANAVNPRFGLG